MSRPVLALFDGVLDFVLPEGKAIAPFGFTGFAAALRSKKEIDMACFLGFAALFKLCLLLPKKIHNVCHLMPKNEKEYHEKKSLLQINFTNLIILCSTFWDYETTLAQKIEEFFFQVFGKIDNIGRTKLEQ